MNRAVRVEWWKLKRSPVTVTATALMVILLPAMALGFYSVAQQGGTGPLAQKAGAFLIGEGWEGYLGAVDQIAAAAMFLGTGFVVAWTFGREHTDRTFPSLFALPVSRTSIAGAKFLVLAGWITLLSLLVVAVSLGIGVAAGVGPIQTAVIGPALLRLLAISLSTSMLSLTIGLVASVGRGYLPAVGALILIVVAAQMSVLFGIGGWFPFAIPGLIAVSGSEGAPVLIPMQIALVPVATAVGLSFTVRWWRRAEAV